MKKDALAGSASLYSSLDADRYFRLSKLPAALLHSGFAATIINGMRAQKIGRVLGIGVRVAGRIAGERLGGQEKPPSSPTRRTGSASTAASAARSAGRATAQVSGGVSRGIGGFFKVVTRLGGILFLEVTGAFYLILGVAFTPFLWKSWQAGLKGPGVWHFAVEALVTLMFLYLGLSSFWRARRR